jgi:glucuronate isomerase
MIAEDYHFQDLGEAWLAGDHYKWRAMRTHGVNEDYCTGEKSYREKFQKWAETVPYTLGNPLYHWTHLELARYFGIFDLLSPANAGMIFDKASAMLTGEDMGTRGLLQMMKVEVVGTTDDPVDSLEHHQALKDFSIKIRPTFRPDNVIKTEVLDEFNAYITRLEQVSGKTINNLDTLVEVLDERHAYFDSMGCRASDHGLSKMYYVADFVSKAPKAFEKLRSGKALDVDENEAYCTYMMYELCKMNHKRGWVQQFHLGAIRNNNTRIFRNVGLDTGHDSIGNNQDSYRMSRFLDLLDNEDKLAKSILYNLNPADNEMFITMVGNFQDGSVAGKMQYGAAWWFLDQKAGMEKHLKDLSVLGLLSHFVGMVTDSRSFLSYPRHEYFRRIVCNYIGGEVEKGLIPNDDSLLKELIERVSYRNAAEYFGF